MAGATGLPYYTLTKQEEESLSEDVWKWKLYALKKSRPALTQLIPMPNTPYLDLTTIYSSAGKWDALLQNMEGNSKLVDSIWLLVQERVQRHQLLRMSIREDFLTQLVKHCADGSRLLAVKDSKNNIEAKRVEMRDVQIDKQNCAFKQILETLEKIPLDDNEPKRQSSSDLLNACLQGVRKHVKISRELIEDRKHLLEKVSHQEHAQNELEQQVASLNTMITEMERKERAISEHLLQTREEHKRDVSALVNRIEGLIDDSKKDREQHKCEIKNLIDDNKKDREEHKSKMAVVHAMHEDEIDNLIETLTVMHIMDSSRASSEKNIYSDDEECDIKNISSDDLDRDIDELRKNYLK